MYETKFQLGQRVYCVRRELVRDNICPRVTLIEGPIHTITLRDLHTTEYTASKIGKCYDDELFDNLDDAIEKIREEIHR